MAAVTLADKFFVDGRFDALGLHLGVDPDAVRTRMARVWSWQTENYTADAPTYVVPEAVLVGLLKSLDASRALVAAGLAEQRENGFYIRGSEGQIEWLWRRRARASKGGVARAVAAAQASPKLDASSSQAGRKLSRDGVQAELGEGLRAASGIRDQGSDLRSEASPPLKPLGQGIETAEPRPPRAAPTGPHAAVTAAFFAAFEQQTGAKPTWGAKQGAMVKKLLDAHSAEDVIARIERLFAGVLPWLSPPYDIGTLVQHFDKLAPIAPPRVRGPGGVPRATESNVATAEEVGLTIL